MKIDEKTLLAQELESILVKFQKFGLQNSHCQKLTHSEYMLLVAIKHFIESNHNGIKVSDLSTYLQITPAIVTHLINSLEEGGYVGRLADSADRRIVLVNPTAKGNSITEIMTKEFLENFKGLVGYLGEKDSKELVRLISSTLTYFTDKKVIKKQI